MSNSFGLYDNSYNLILKTISDSLEIEQAIIFGSRAMGNYKKGSDIDIAIFGKKIDFEVFTKLHGELNERLPIPYFIDIINFETLTNKNLKEHILKEGKLLFKRDANY